MCWIYSVVFVVRLWWHGDTFGHRPGMTFLHQVCERNIQTFLHRRNLNCRSARIQSLWCNTRRIIPVNSNCLAGIWKGHLEVPQPQELRIPSNHAYEPLTKWGQSPMVYRRKFTGKEHLGESTWNTCKTGHRYICQRSNNASSKANPLKNVHSKFYSFSSVWFPQKNGSQIPMIPQKKHQATSFTLTTQQLLRRSAGVLQAEVEEGEADGHLATRVFHRPPTMMEPGRNKTKQKKSPNEGITSTWSNLR